MSRSALAARLWRHAARPVKILRVYELGFLRPDLLAGATVAVVAVPQSVAYAAIANLPPSYGLYSACVASIVGALWGSSRYLSTGPTNAASILVLSALVPLAAVGSPEFLMAASLMAVLVGLFRIALGALGFGFLVNFASRGVLIGFAAGAAVLIAANQLPHLLRLDGAPGIGLREMLVAAWAQRDAVHLPSLAIGIAVVVLTLLVNRLSNKFPGSLLAMVAAGGFVAWAGTDALGVRVVGEVPRELPRFTRLSFDVLVNEGLLDQMLTGSLAVALLGLVEAMSIARALARRRGERLDANQEFVGQGLANVATGLLSGYACSGSFTRSEVNFQAGARTQLSGVFAGLFVLGGVLLFGPLAAFLPKAALAGLLFLIAFNMVDRHGIRRIWSTSRVETAIMAATFLATLVFPLEFAVLSGVLISLAVYLYESSMPAVAAVVPDENYRHFVEKPEAPVCPQLAVMNIQGPLFFGATTHVEDTLLDNMVQNPGQSLLLLRMHGVHRADLTGIDMLEGIVRRYREAGGDVFMVQARPAVREAMAQAGFDRLLGADHYLPQEGAIEHLFEHEIDPAVCIYECEHRVFAECQALPKHAYDARLPAYAARPIHPLRHLTVVGLEELVARERGVCLVDVREPEETASGHLAGVRLVPLRRLVEAAPDLPRDRPIVLVCRSGRRSTRGMHMLLDLGFADVYNLKGGILSWKAAGRSLVVE